MFCDRDCLRKKRAVPAIQPWHGPSRQDGVDIIEVDDVDITGVKSTTLPFLSLSLSPPPPMLVASFSYCTGTFFHRIQYYLIAVSFFLSFA